MHLNPLIFRLRGLELVLNYFPRVASVCLCECVTQRFSE